MGSKRTSDQAVEFIEKNREKPLPRGISVALTDEQLEEALDRLADGGQMRTICANLGVTRTTLHKRACVDEEFREKLFTAMELGTYSLIEDAYNAILGGELSTGDIQRDREIMKFAQWYAGRINRRVFGERQQVDISVSQPTVVLAPIPNLPVIDQARFTDASFEPVEDDAEEDEADE